MVDEGALRLGMALTTLGLALGVGACGGSDSRPPSFPLGHPVRTASTSAAPAEDELRQQEQQLAICAEDRVGIGTPTFHKLACEKTPGDADCAKRAEACFELAKHMGEDDCRVATRPTSRLPLARLQSLGARCESIRFGLYVESCNAAARAPDAPGCKVEAETRRVAMREADDRRALALKYGSKGAGTRGGGCNFTPGDGSCRDRCDVDYSECPARAHDGDSRPTWIICGGEVRDCIKACGCAK